MIDHISIENFAVISSTEIDFEDGLNVITGETGAGKSIVVEAMNLALGGRADSSYIRHDEDRARVQLLATIDGSELVISREIASTGKNLCRVNGELTTVANVQKLAGTVADIHGQYENQKLLDPANHLALVDAFHHEDIDPKKAAFAEAYGRYRTARLALEKLIRDEQESRRKKDYLTNAAAEIDEAALQPGEEKSLTERAALLQNREKIFEAAGAADHLLSDPDQGALTQLSEAVETLRGAAAFSGDLRTAAETIESLRLGLDDAAGSVRALLDAADFEPDEIDRVLGRLDVIDRLKAKYGDSIEDVLAFRDRCRDELSLIEHFDERKEKLNAEAKTALAALKKASAALTDARKASAAELGGAIERELRDLNFDRADISIEIRRAPAITSAGEDECEILLSTNRGEPLKSLAKTASGGEISRVMLAVKNVTGTYDSIPTMIFDEIDAGISGVTASVVARKLRDIAKTHQIICITHLPQIAAAADASYRIYKDSDDSATYTHVEKLSGAAKTEEIARLLGGDHVTDTTRKNAAELIESMHGVKTD